MSRESPRNFLTQILHRETIMEVDEHIEESPEEEEEEDDDDQDEDYGEEMEQGGPSTSARRPLGSSSATPLKSPPVSGEFDDKIVRIN